MLQRSMLTTPRILLVLLALGLVLAACAPAATQEPAVDASPTATDMEEALPEVPELTPREPRDEVVDEEPEVEEPVEVDEPAVDDPLEEEPAEEEPVEEEPVEEEPVTEEPVEEEPVEEEPVEEEPVTEEPMEEEPMEEELVEDPEVMALPSGEPVRIAINVGGDEVEAAGMTWVADQFFEGGRTTANEAVSDIEATDDAAIYLSARTAETDLEGFRYSIPVPAEGIYEVRLHFAELYWGAPGAGEGGGAGDRVFNVSFEDGVVELSGIDLVAEAGSMSAVIKAFEVPVEGETLDIDFSATINRPLLSAIEVFGPIMQGN